MIALDELLDLLPASLLRGLEARFQLDSKNQVKLTGSALAICLLNSLLNHPLVTQRLLEETFRRKTGQPVHYSGIGRALGRVEPSYFRALFEHLYRQLAGMAPARELNSLRLRLVDATTVTLSAKLLHFGLLGRSGARARKQLRASKAVFALTEEGLPSLLRICKEPREHDDNHALGEPLLADTQPNDLWVFDRGLKARETLLSIHQANAFFLTPLSDQGLRVTQSLQSYDEDQKPLPSEKPGPKEPHWRLVGVEYVHFENLRPHPKWLKMPLILLRLIRFDERTSAWKPLALISNLPLSADATQAGPFTFLELAELYRRRWEIELFFKLLKQHLGYRHLTSRIENGITIMIYITLVAALLMIWYKQRAHIQNGWRSVKYWLAENTRLWTETALAQSLGPPLVSAVT